MGDIPGMVLEYPGFNCGNLGTIPLNGSITFPEKKISN